MAESKVVGSPILKVRQALTKQPAIRAVKKVQPLLRTKATLPRPGLVRALREGRVRPHKMHLSQDQRVKGTAEKRERGTFDKSQHLNLEHVGT